jgi:tellurite resistance protein TerC
LRRFLIGTIGFSVVLIGLVMLVLPGPAIVIVPLGFAILASEFAWARRIWRRGTILVSRIRANPLRGRRWERGDMTPNRLASGRNTDFQVYASSGVLVR